MNGAGLYIHIPFCVRKCGYCDFNSHASTGELHEAYQEALLEDLRRVREQHGPVAIDTVFIGGGTPSLFPPAWIGAILERVARDFRLEAREITMEANPGTVERHDFAGYRHAGVTRVSMGAQSFDAAELAFLERIHSPAEIVEAFRAVRAAGFDNINLDLIFALPGQTPGTWERSLAQAVALEPEHLSAYNLTFEPGTEFTRRRARGELAEMPEDLQASFLTATAARLDAAGYARYEISNFARPDRACAHNLRYWRRLPVLAAGAGAFGFDGRRRWSNVRSPQEYIRRARAGDPLEAFSEIPSAAEAMTEAVLCRLRLDEGLDADAFHAEFGSPPADAFPLTLRQSLDAALLTARGPRLTLTDAGILVSDSLFARAASEIDARFGKREVASGPNPA
ncbi:MAG: radical SAM family heme chaperone HemW [Candidatus Brocadiae bacterium]|nr:radical SAM family heme chaperone HemW [Candidatus Brocadiia bacterium]